ncbi:unnamed protein product [Kuraishia capsulata CBS 1993]|uniref:Aminotransferase class I/classII large domain-containing protein n=1 Tax=Kuraishia capsulata CBS 1993 TaxID=1382522 RepID=W6MLY5_9ASCO|nr:uncharacterized protein KUCA_T00003165001 [Kuraishia capsulata CBS 1993]CDK27188.1 unnamed protein product [Kuraishia capsulata CBS 1993]
MSLDPTETGHLPSHNEYFQLKDKDVWSLINETAAQTEKETGVKMVHLGQGFYSYSPPDFAIEEAKKALDIAMVNQYAPTRGRMSLIDALSKTYSHYYDHALEPSEIMVSTGANEGILSCFFGFLNPGDEVIVFEPFFDQYISNIEMAGGKVVYVQIHAPKDFNENIVSGKDWTIDPQELESAISSKTKMIVLNTPQNPLGKVFTREELTMIGNLAVKHNLLVVSDEVYENLYYVPDRVRIHTISPEIDERCLVVGSSGKTFAATGWRIGWVIGNKALINYVAAAHTRICFSSPGPMQEAVAGALLRAKDNGYYEKSRAAFVNKYKIFTSVFDYLGLPYTKAEGGYYLYVNFHKLQIPDNYVFPDLFLKSRDFQLAYWLIKEIGVVSIPPSEFYISEHKAEAKDCLRFAICKQDEVLQEAVKRLKKLKPFVGNRTNQ